VELLDPQGDYLTRAWRDHVYPLAARLKVVMKMPTIQTRSRLAHEAAKWAGNQGWAEAYNRAVFRAFFEFGHNIGDIPVLQELAGELGLDREDLGRALASHRFTAEVLTDEKVACDLGVRGVPSYVANGHVLASGVQTVGRLKVLMTVGPGLPLF
jgi:predicted DsbA family dithiol-disulfide isomerase